VSSRVEAEPTGWPLLEARLDHLAQRDVDGLLAARHWPDAVLVASR
jgi:hypothetical protein